MSEGTKVIQALSYMDKFKVENRIKIVILLPLKHLEMGRVAFRVAHSSQLTFNVLARDVCGRRSSLFGGGQL